MDKSKVRELRKHLTETERALWKHLRLRQFSGYKFRRQQPIGKYIVDFACLEKRLIIEIDGGQHSEQTAYDLERDTWLESQGFSVLRFWNNQILKEMEAVKEIILDTLTRQPLPPTLILHRKWLCRNMKTPTFWMRGETVGWKRLRAVTFNTSDSGVTSK